MRRLVVNVLVALVFLAAATHSLVARASTSKTPAKTASKTASKTGSKAASKAAPAAPAPWKISGEMEESCSCDGACPCWFGNKPTKMNCSGDAAFFITKGSYGKVPLDGLAIANVVQSPEGKSMVESMGTFNFSIVYIDEKANPEQRKALEAIAGQILPPFAPPERTKIQYTSIRRTVAGKDHTVSIGSYGTFTGHLIETAYGGAPKIVNPVVPDPIHKEYLQGVTTRGTYKDAAEFDFSNSNYMYNQFSVTNKDYEALAATMQKMQEKGGMGAGTEKK